MKDKLTIVIKTFIRYGVCRDTIGAFKAIAPGVRIIVIDDTPVGLRQKLEGVEHVVTEPDIGLSAGRNLGVEMSNTEFVFVSDDDSPPKGMTQEDLTHVVGLLGDRETDLIGWEGWKFVEVEDRMEFHRVDVDSDFVPCDITQNAFVARRSALLESPWNPDIKINGEHFSFFLNWSRKGFRCASSDMMKFTNLKTRNAAYNKYRRRSFRDAAKRDVGVKGVLWVNTL